MHNIRRYLLAPAALLYAAGIFVRNRLFDFGVSTAHKAALPVISIGNITMGGTGKTPLVDFVIKHYTSRGLKTAILSRGYKRKSRGVQLVSDDRQILLGSREAGDECAMLAQNNPGTIVVVAEIRKDGTDFIEQRFAGKLPDVVVLDDGFQHRQLYRDLDIVIINSRAPFIDDRLIPAGGLREPGKNLDRADLLILSKVTDPQQSGRLEDELRTTGKPLVKTGIRAGKPVLFAGPESPAPKRVIGMAGIGQPESFVDSLQTNGMEVVSHAFFPDHADFPLKSMKSLASKALRESLSIITTEKDYFRLSSNRPVLEAISRVPCYYLPVEIEIIEGRKLLEQMLDQAVS
ncbi:MAG: tetraacyldisaccharide 4'-kinase [Chlorobium sp.]|nr:tetraacyldisaccharide 4'-kinase [Chlorobium sp.]MCW8819661.1 tetraacyldisaccharide 4'-kinase [Ignavibacteriaceae bacterium]